MQKWEYIAFFITFILLLMPIVLSKDMPVPHFTTNDCDCPELGWPIQSNYSSYGFDLSCVYQKSNNKEDYYNTLTLYITSWYDPEDTNEAFEIFRDYDYKNAKEDYGNNNYIVEDINEKDKISFIYRVGNSSYTVLRKVHYTDTPLISINGNYNKYRADKSQPPIDPEVVAWADALEECGKRLIDGQDISAEKIKGKISILGFPLKHATIYIDSQEKTTTNEKGEFTLSVANQENYNIIVEFQYEKNNHIFYRVLMDKDPIKLEIQVNNNKINSMEFDVGLASFSVDDLNQDISQEIALEKLIKDKDLLLIPVNYLHMQEALEYYTDVLNVDLSKNSVDLFIYTGLKSSYNFENNKQWINLDAQKSSYEDNYRPFTVYHEFTHYVQHTLVGTEALASYLDENNINHGGYANEKSLDSFSEGLAAFMATVIANNYKRYWADEGSNCSSLYPYFGSLEPNILAWEFQGQGEEYALAGVLWDLVDGEEEAKKDSAADKAIIQEIMQESFKKYDFNEDNSWDHVEFMHSLIDVAEYNGNFDDLFEERELRVLSESFAENESEEFLNKILAYGKTEPGSVTQEEMHNFIKDNIDFFQEELKQDIGEDYVDLPKKITLNMIMEKVTDSPDDDNVAMEVEEVWDLIEKSNFNLPLKDLKKADKILIEHGIYIETSKGDGEYNFGEPYLNKNKNKRRDSGETFVDLGTMKYDSLEKIGVASNYERLNRQSSVPLEGQFIKSNKEIAFYEIEYIVSTKNYFGLSVPTMIYTIRARNEEGLVYVPLMKDAIIEIEPEGVATEEPLIFFSNNFIENSQEAIDNGYFIENEFDYTGNPPVYKNALEKKSSNLLLYLGIIAGVVILLAIIFSRNKKK